jgi:hypothetical protein
MERKLMGFRTGPYAFDYDFSSTTSLPDMTTHAHPAAAGGK